jgi:hypothetical protein
MHFRFIDGERGIMIRGDILLHVVNHATCILAASLANP